MRVLDKDSMVRILKEVSDKLTKAEIRNEIPYMYINKKEFDHIKILIPFNTDVSTLSDILNSVEYTNTSKFIDFYYKEFRFIFIRCPETEFIQQFYYYSWDILPTLINVILNKFGIRWCPDGLRYYNEDGGNFLITNFMSSFGINVPLLTNSFIKDLFDFLDMKIDIYKRGFFDFFSEATFITTSSYYDSKIFEEYKLDEKDFLYFVNKKEYEEALIILSNFHSEYDFKHPESYFTDIEDMFPGSKFLEKVVRLDLKNKKGDINKIQD